jgi:protoheme IX farnesyltransferase
MQAIFARLKAYISLTEPAIQLLGVCTGAAALFMESSLISQPIRFLFLLILLALGGGSAKILNQICERNVDALMERTRNKRPLPSGRVTLIEATLFGLILVAVSVGGMMRLFNLLAGFLLLSSIVFYVFFYTLYLKPRTSQNIVIGGLAGAMGPVICWAAAVGRLEFDPFLLSAVIFFWTPPHFWALAIYYKEDYQKTGIPMLPIVLGEEKTWIFIQASTLITVLFSLALALTGLGVLYLIAATLIGIGFIAIVLRAGTIGTREAARRVFILSIVYMVLLCVAIVGDRLLSRLS